MTTTEPEVSYVTDPEGFASPAPSTTNATAEPAPPPAPAPAAPKAEPAKAATKKAGRAPQAKAEKQVTVNTTVSKELKDLVARRAAHEDRTETVIVRRAIKAYMEGWSASSPVD